MSEDARGARRPRLHYYVANPSEEGSSDDDRPSLLTPAAPYAPQPAFHPNRPPQAHPAALTTHIPHQPPSVSSPSSSSSPAAEESTPPPTTPAQPHDHPHDAPEPLIASHEAPVAPMSRKGKLLQTLKSPFYARPHRQQLDSPPKRPRTVPSAPLCSSVLSIYMPFHKSPGPTPTESLSSASTVSDKTLIVVTADSDWYVTVDISGAPNAAYIRERILNKLNIRDDEQPRFSVFLTEMGAYAIGEPFSDERLFAYCRDKGDSKGSLKFFVTDSSAPVHEQTLQPQRSYSPTASSIPPPVLPSFNANPIPLRPKRRSRQESVSSVNEQQLESAGGYEADLDNPDRDRDVYKAPPPPPAHPLPSPPQQHQLNNAPSSPRHTRRVNGPQQRPSSPHLRPPRMNTTPPPETSRFEHVNHEYRPLAVTPPAPPLSPNRLTFMPDEKSLMPTSHRVHGRSGSDAGAEREQALRAAEQQYENVGRQWRTRQQHTIGGRLRAEPSRENLSAMNDRRKRYVHEEDPVRSDSWVVVPSQSGRPSDQELSPAAQETGSNILPSRTGPRGPQASRTRVTSPYSGLPVTFPGPPRHPPPVPTPMHEPREARPVAQRPSAGVPLPHKLFAWRGEERKEQKTMSHSTSQWNSRLTKGSKSVDNLRAGFINTHPANLTPGGTRRAPPPLPVKPSAPPVPSYSSYSPGMPKSFESRPRPLPVQGSLHGSTVDLSRDTYSSRGTPYNLMSPSQEPYPRPQSAFGDSMTSPTRRQQRLQSPTYTNLDSGDSIRSPRGISPSRYHVSQLSASRLESSYSNRSDRSSDVQSGAETSFSTPPLTPISPRSPLYPNRDKTSSSRPSTSESKINGTHDVHRGSESTLRPEDQQWFASTIGNEGTIIAPRGQDNGRPDTPPSSTSEMPESTLLNQYDIDDDYGTAIWKKRPTAESERPKSILRPPLKVQIETPSGPSSTSSNTVTQNTQHASFATPPVPSRLPVTPETRAEPHPQPQRRAPTSGTKGPRGSTFTDRQSSTWAPRPPPEDVYERLEEFFPEHDLDKPVIEASSGGTSPTLVEPPIAPPPTPVPAERMRNRGKKSIRIVAEEHKKLIDRSSRGDATSYSNISRKRSTKLWGSKLEEVTTAQAKLQAGHKVPESPSGGATFKWVRGELIGRGTYGRVYLALNATTGEMIAVKQVELPRTASDKSDSRQITVVQALKMESETLKVLDHPNIVQYLGFEETPENLSIFLEYVPGGSIGSCLLKYGKFNEDVTKSFTSQILAGLEYLHSKGILHRDLKADNILVETSGICKISDFGISKRTDDVNGGAHTAMQGTVFWMAPEVINTQKKGYNFKIDIWSVGCVVLEMWAGMRPWMGDEVVAVMFKLYQSKQPPPVPVDVHLSELADDFRRKCFAINPEDRPTSTELRKHPYLVLPPDWVFTDF
ncbi:hypothetical protein H0H87_009169 [Tephrocybe sp. NHM501043]|nr:hypothetical protein H0H87_009169 [Tephrocybe sp. NHM501043]